MTGIVADVLALAFLAGGIFFLLLAALGVLRLPDAFLRMHAATKAGLAGAGLALFGAAAAIGTVEAWVKAALALLFLAATAPIASHLLGRAAYISGAEMWKGTKTNALDGVLGPPGHCSGPEAHGRLPSGEGAPGARAPASDRA